MQRFSLGIPHRSESQDSRKAIGALTNSKQRRDIDCPTRSVAATTTESSSMSIVQMETYMCTLQYWPSMIYRCRLQWRYCVSDMRRRSYPDNTKSLDNGDDFAWTNIHLIGRSGSMILLRSDCHLLSDQVAVILETIINGFKVYPEGLRVWACLRPRAFLEADRVLVPHSI